MTDAPAVELRDVDKYFGSLHVLRGINLTIARGEVVVVIGPSGSGKSTLCRAINRLEPIDKGEIRVFGMPLSAEGKALAGLRQRSRLRPERRLARRGARAPRQAGDDLLGGGPTTG